MSVGFISSSTSSCKITGPDNRPLQLARSHTLRSVTLDTRTLGTAAVAQRLSCRQPLVIMMSSKHGTVTKLLISMQADCMTHRLTLAHGVKD